MSDSYFFDEIKKHNRLLLFVCLAIVIGFTVYTLFFNVKTASSLEFFDTCMQLSASDGDGSYVITIDYEEIRGVETMSGLSLGEMVSGTQERDLWFGTWKNDRFGEYILYVDPRVETYSVIATEACCYIVNFEGTKTTESFSEALVRLLVDKGYWSDMDR